MLAPSCHQIQIPGTPVGAEQRYASSNCCRDPGHCGNSSRRTQRSLLATAILCGLNRVRIIEDCPPLATLYPIAVGDERQGYAHRAMTATVSAEERSRLVPLVKRNAAAG